MCVGLAFRDFVFSCFLFVIFIALSFFFLKTCVLVMNPAAKCDQHCEVQDSVNHQKFESMLFFRVILEIEVVTPFSHFFSVCDLCTDLDKLSSHIVS